MFEAAITGTLGRDPARGTSGSGKPWLRMSLAVGNGDNTAWVSVITSVNVDELAEQLHKGDKAYAEGHLSFSKWTGRDGVERSGLSLAAWRVEPLGQIGKRRPRKPHRPPLTRDFGLR